MKIKSIAKVVIGALLLGFALQAGVVVFAVTGEGGASSTSDTAAPAASASESAAIAEVQISQDVLNKIKESDPTHYDRNVTNYKTVVITRDVHQKFKNEIDRLVLAGHRLPDILIAYEYLYHNYGDMSRLEFFVNQKKMGKTWETIFMEYKQSRGSFVPRDFDSGELAAFISTPGISPDDIMLADRVSFESGKQIDELLRLKTDNPGRSWKDINAELGILNSASVLPRVKITAEDMELYLQSGALSRKQIAEAFVLANKLGVQPKIVIGHVGSGLTEEAVFAEILQSKLDS
ncbi:hypothetical protein [Paenibacillus hamazuiensis]|uniref:hypothetical protein n=1 Tax=Paenibacillus hamazuiensis TaxID=2936508 RepID=UPI00200DECF4|nr:hypothetical protein [Paenibacillus hamazuiensis]